MKNIARLLGVVCLATPLLAAPHHKRIVVVISLDGFPAYAMQEPRLPAHTLSQLAKDGASADGMQIVNPTVTWPNHTTLVTGVDASRHRVIFNGELVRNGPAQPVTVNISPEKAELVKVPTIYDLASEAGLVTAEVAWPATKGAKTIQWNFAAHPNPGGTIARELIQQGTVSRNQLLDFFGASQAWRDEVYTDAAIDILRKHTPNLLLVHFLETDSIQHQYGPHSAAADLAYAFEDDRVRDIVDALRQAKLLHRATVFVVSDHGFRVIRHVIDLNALLAKNGLIRSNGADYSADAWTLSHGGIAMAYVTNPEKRAEFIPRLKTMFSSVEGVARVYSATDFPTLGLPLAAKNSQSPDLLITAKPDYSFEDDVQGDVSHTVFVGGEHGYLNSDAAMNALFIAWGSGIRKGIRLGVIQNVDVAPTVAKLLGLKMTGVDGHVLDQILK